MMKRKLFAIYVVCIIALMLQFKTAQAVQIDITDPALTHFASFTNDPPAGALSHISDDAAIANSDFGWHHSPHSGGPDIAGILLGSSSYAVTTLRLQVHSNPFKDFDLQGSNDTTTGLDGSWSNILTSTVTERAELAWQQWDFLNTNQYTAYRINMKNYYVGGWAMYRWELLAEENSNPIPEPATIALLGIGLAGLTGVASRRKWKKKAIDNR